MPNKDEYFASNPENPYNKSETENLNTPFTGLSKAMQIYET